MTYNTSERQSVRRAEKDAKIAERQRTETVTGIMSVRAGRAWICELLERCHVFTTSFSPNALNTAFAEGERNVGLRILADVMSACPEQYVLMMREQNERSAAAERRAEDTNGRDQGSDASADGGPSEDAYAADGYPGQAH